MKLVTAEQMREIDRVTIDQRGIPGLDLMRRAGRAVACAALDFFQPESVAIVTGKGNNAGDGFVAACELHRRGIAVALFALEDPDALKGDAALAYAEFATLRLAEEADPAAECRPREWVEPTLAELEVRLPEYDLIIDALFGTGLKGPLTGHWADTIDLINALPLPVLAIDIPSGLPAEPLAPGAEKEMAIIRATRTVTIGRPKVGMLVGPGVAYTGAVTVEEIQFPADLLACEASTINLMTQELAAGLLPARPPAGHKGTFGKLLVIAGSAGMTGAAVLCARSAARSGAGLVYVAYPEPLSTIIESHLIEPVKLPLPGEARWFRPQHLTELARHLPEMDAVALGPGLGRHAETAAFLRALLPQIHVPLVIDADGLNLLADMPELLAGRAAVTILTPHPGEAARLLKLDSIAAVERDRLGAFTDFSRRHGCTVVLKGAQSITTEPTGQRWVNPTGNSGLAKGGSGDVLTGLIAGLAAQGVGMLPDATAAARLGVFIHGLAADLAAQRLGTRAMLPSDVIESLSAAFLHLEKTAISVPVG